MKKNTRIFLSAGIVYLLLLLLLYKTESAAGNAGFASFWDAVWYSLVTMTTVGYGDITPVTAGGKLIGIVFALCSVGILAALVGFTLRLIGGQLIPQLRLMRQRHRPWYIFDEENEDSAVLADAIRRENPGSVILFLSGQERSDIDAVRLHVSPETALSRFRGRADLSLFFMSADSPGNYARALQAASGFSFPVYCMSGADVDGAPQNLHLFGREDVLSRFYWQTHPLRKEETCVVLIGCGLFGSALLERALLTNIFPRGRYIRYHVFLDTAGFRLLHSELAAALSGADPDEDLLLFHSEDWREARELLRKADRILLAADTDEENLSAYDNLKKWYVTKNNIHIRLSQALPGLCSFGTREEILTPEFVIRDSVNREAVMMNSLYNAGAAHPTAWRDLTAFYRQSNIAAADHLIVKVRYLLDCDTLTSLTREDCREAYRRYRALYPERAELFQEMEHRRWMRFSLLSNWQYAPVRDNAARLHPLLIPFESLPPEEKKKDDFAWELLGQLEL